jgi:hypothetical protein
MSIDAMQQALEALEYHQDQTRPIHKTQETIIALRQAIEEAEYDNLTVKFGEKAKVYLVEAKKSWEQAEIKRLTDLNRQLVAAAKELGAADDVHEWDDAWAKMAKLMRQGEINATSSQDGR